LLTKIKDITLEICNIKEQKKASPLCIAYTNVHNHKLNGPLQIHHEEHDKDVVHYEDNTGSDHQPPHNKCNPGHCVLTQCPAPKDSTSSSPLLPLTHPSEELSETLEGERLWKIVLSTSNGFLKTVEDNAAENAAEKIPEDRAGYVKSAMKTCDNDSNGGPRWKQCQEEEDWDSSEGREEGVEDPGTPLKTVDSWTMSGRMGSMKRGGCSI